jgi:DNA gyrase subunit A
LHDAGRALTENFPKRWSLVPNPRDRVVMRLIEDEMKQSFLDYSMSVIVQRALPDVRDGLKPVHRRILFSMHEAGLSPTRPFKKSATVVGDVLGKYHPHGDTAVYDALVRMVQDFSLRYPLVEGQGNFGSIDGDSAAAYRYTEARLSAIATELLADIDKETVEFAPNFDDRLVEPVVLPGKVPNLLINGSSGIAVGMSTNIPPHNLREVVRAAVHVLDDPECTVADLMEHIPGPDFPTGGLIVGREGIRQAYETGRGRIVMQGRIGRETRRGGREQLVVTEIPYATSKTRIIEQIADLAKKGKAPDISDLRDESDRDGIRLVIELKRGADATRVVRSLLKWTALQSTFGVIALALDGGVPREFTLKEMLERFRDHRVEVIVRRSRWERDRAAEEAHLLEGLLIALKNIDRVVAIIRSSRQRETAREKLRTEFKLTERQADAVLMMRLYRLTQLETRDLRQKLETLEKRIAELDLILGDPEMQIAEVRRELMEITARFGDARRTRIVEGKPDSMVEAMVAQEDVVVTISHQGFAKQIPMYLYRRRLTSGKPIAEMERYGDDYLEHVFPASTSDPLLFFTEQGQAITVGVAEIPEVERSSRGRPLFQLLGLQKAERITALMPVARQSREAVLIFVTEQGMVKRTPLDQFGTQRSGGINAINLRQGDRLLDVYASDGTSDLLLISRDGRVIRFVEGEIPEVGRAAQGVRGMKLATGDRIVGSALVRRDAAICAVSENGFARRLPMDEFTMQKRDGRGVVGFAADLTSGKLVSAREVVAGDDLMLLTGSGSPVRLRTADVPFGECGDPLQKVVNGRIARILEVTRVGEPSRPASGEGDEEAVPLTAGEPPEPEMDVDEDMEIHIEGDIEGDIEPEPEVAPETETAAAIARPIEGEGVEDEEDGEAGGQQYDLLGS